MATIFLGLGSNLGNRESYLRQAIVSLQEKVGTLLKCSDFWETAPDGFTSDHLFLNAVITMQTTVPPLSLLDVTEGIEREMGRTKKSKQGMYHDREIDIDVLAYGNLIFHSRRLILPHPLLHTRTFVLQPLNQIEPTWKHPVFELTPKELLAKRESAPTHAEQLHSFPQQNHSQH